MWFLGLLAGLIVGGTIGHFEGAIAGAILGAIAGALYRAANPVQAGVPGPDGARRIADLEGKVDHIYRCLEDVNRRLSAIERSGAAPVQDAPRDAYAVPTPAAEAVTKPFMTPPVEPPLSPVAAAIVGTAAEPHPGTAEVAQAPAVPDTGARRPEIPREGADTNPITRWLLGGNTLVRVGMIVLFFGVAFLLKYAAERDLVPIELRLAAVAAGAVALLLVGWRLRERRPGYGLMLQGGGIGVLYLDVFAALRVYQLVPPEFAFAVLVGIAACSAALAVLQDSRALAITGVAGGFLAPILTSTGGGNHVALFSFYAVLDAGILAIAYYKAWRELNLIGFAFTFVIGLAWGSQYYRPELFSTTEPFLILFFVFYVAIAVLFSLRQALQIAHYVDGTLVFGTPLVAFGLQTALVRDMEFGAAWSAFALAAFYLLLATMLYARKRQTLAMLVESLLALGIGFATLAVPLAFDGRWTSAVWAVEGAAIVWIGVRQNRVLARIFGMLLQLAAGIAFLVDTGAAAGATPVMNSFYLGCVMVSAAGLFCSRYVELNAARVTEGERIAAGLLFIWGTAWWFGAGFTELARHAPVTWGLHPQLLFCAGSCGLFGFLWRRLDWNSARYVTLAVVPLAAAVAAWMAVALAPHPHPFAHHAYIGWVLAFGVHLWALRSHEERDAPLLERLHAGGFWLLAVILSWETGWQIDHYVAGRHVWPLIAWAVVPGALIAVFAAHGERLGWPVDKHRHAYLYAGALPLAIFLLGWVIYVNFASNGDPAPLPYVPLANPLDLAQAGALLALATWFVGVKRLNLPHAQLPASADAMKVLGVVLFIALNGVLLRTLHHYADVPFRLHAMLRSVLVQAAFSLFWTLLALVAMVVATRRGLRALWAVGATLLGVVIAKLFLIDLANSGTVERWVSFIGVGILVIVIGYFAPVPPKAQEKSA